MSETGCHDPWRIAIEVEGRVDRYIHRENQIENRMRERIFIVWFLLPRPGWGWDSLVKSSWSSASASRANSSGVFFLRISGLSGSGGGASCTSSFFLMLYWNMGSKCNVRQRFNLFALTVNQCRHIRQLDFSGTRYKVIRVFFNLKIDCLVHPWVRVFPIKYYIAT